MSCLSWNYRGLGNPLTVQDLHQLVQSKFPSFVFFMETKCRRNSIEKLKRQLQFANSFVIDCKGLSGGLAFLWSEDVEAKVLSYTQHHISLLIQGEVGSREWVLTGFYGNPDTARERRALKALKPALDKGWVCIGDFNEVLSLRDKSGGRLRPFNQIKAFRAAIEAYSLSNTGYIGNKFTWANGRSGQAFIKERIDRAFCNIEWSEIFLYSKFYNLALSLDHCPILITMEQFQVDSTRNDKPFRYEARWALREDCYGGVEKAWNKPR
ncbi:uncharacterized protein LOC122274426 [Carya illinoinensis]|uniref:uncharacterized protein LOC122274426 n=1 Tax=Carya illinoinensis TaxID=32201 RepID=UPI001C727BD8|nr:uncharacterized protein LOC122274426 [Carya illinoinensis]